MKSIRQLESLLERIDGRGYKTYKDIRGSWDAGDVVLHVDHVQGDPFATPSRVRVFVPMEVAAVPADLCEPVVRRRALEDRLAREVEEAMRRAAGARTGSGKSGVLTIDAGGQEVLERTAVRVSSTGVEARVRAGLPAAGRRILGRAALRLLCESLPGIVRNACCWKGLPAGEIRRFVECVENQEAIRAQLAGAGLIAFVADGSLLPRERGASDLPMDPSRSVPILSPESLAVAFDVPHAAGKSGDRQVRGMGVPEGITLIVGGGYHGKSTLLRALERGVYPHVPGDGREYVVTRSDVVKIRAEDGRRVEGVDISAFITNLPGGRDTRDFRTEDASGSTSQAASILEALEAGAGALLLDEDTCATNFMVRDARMQRLVERAAEPITPFLDRVRDLYTSRGVSTVLVMGGCGDYFDVADRVLLMREYLPSEVTREARRVAEALPSARCVESGVPLAFSGARRPDPDSIDAFRGGARGRRRLKIDVRDRDQILFGSQTLDLRALEQLVDRSQTRAVGHALHLMTERFFSNGVTLPQALDRLEEFFDAGGLEDLDPLCRSGEHPGEFARPRRYEVAAALNRLRSLRVR